MALSWRKESWGAEAMTFSQSSGDKDVWDDGAILKAFDDALSSHTRKFSSGEEGRKLGKEPSQRSPSNSVSRTYGRSEGMGQQSSSSGRPPSGRPMDYGPVGVGEAGDRTGYGIPGAAGSVDRVNEEGHPQDMSRTRGGVDTSGAAMARRGAGIPGPWEPVVPREVDREAQPAHETLQDGQPRHGYSMKPGAAYDPARSGEYGAHHHPYPPRAGDPFERFGLPPPPPPPAPHPGAGPHAAAFQSLEGIHDDELADLLLAWYYSGYYTGRYRAMQEARNARYRQSHAAPPPSRTAPAPPHGHPASVSSQLEGWDRAGWPGHHPWGASSAQPPAPPGHSGASRGVPTPDVRPNGMGRRTGP